MTVYIIQNQHKWNSGENKFVPKFDFKQSRKWGEIIYLLGPQHQADRPESFVQVLHDKLMTYDPDHDYLVLTGNPLIIGIVCAIAADKYGSLSVLHWNAKERKYFPLRIKNLLTGEISS